MNAKDLPTILHEATRDALQDCREAHKRNDGNALREASTAFYEASRDARAAFYDAQDTKARLSQRQTRTPLQEARTAVDAACIARSAEILNESEGFIRSQMEDIDQGA